MRKKIVTAILVAALAVGSLSGCALLDNEVNELNGSITGNTYNASFYSNEGEKFMDMSGQKILILHPTLSKNSRIVPMVDGDIHRHYLV